MKFLGKVTADWCFYLELEMDVDYNVLGGHFFEGDITIQKLVCNYSCTAFWISWNAMDYKSKIRDISIYIYGRKAKTKTFQMCTGSE